MAPFGLGAAIAMPVWAGGCPTGSAPGPARGGVLVALACALGFTQAGPGAPVAGTALLALATGLALGFVGAPTMGGLCRTLPPELVPQGSSVLFLLAKPQVAPAQSFPQLVLNLTLGQVLALWA